jgi:hypothetical protein
MFAAVLTSENGLVTCMNLHRLVATKRYHLPELDLVPAKEGWFPSTAICITIAGLIPNA